MSRFQYQYDGTEGRSVKERAHQQAGPSRRPIETQDEDYDIDAALEFEQADQYNDWEPHDHLYDEPGSSGAGSSRAVDLSKQSTSHGQSRRTKTNGKGKGRDVLDIASDEHDDQEHADMIPVPIDSRGSVVSDARIETISREIDSIDEQITSLKAARAMLVRDRQNLLNQQKAAQDHLRAKEAQANYTKPLPKSGTINYGDSSQFSWKKKLDGVLDRVFGIKKLRLCQEGVLNAVLDGRDTGGGKSVCFQAPALMSKGVTLVISPLLSLMADQVHVLNAKGVEAVMITGSTPHADIKDITERLTSRDGQIKLCYVTPEKLAKSKTFTNTLGKMYSAGLLSRIAIDESHCCSQMGHDFRPDYKRLSMLKQLYPNTPIIALTATCGKAVLNDVVRILHLEACTSGETAEPYKTVFFSAPLYRPNLHYSVRAKPVQAQALALEMAEEIMLRYPNSSGIIYCLSQKETESFADAIRDCSKGKIKIGTYHAGMSDYDKERIHMRWREGKIKCVVATIAFGMGIDAPDVRYVFHQTISKSMEGYYQETGRAGRDGNDSDCILWFRPADASRLSTLTLSEVEGQKKLHNMLRYALDLKTCRKLLFDSYFGNPANVVAPYAESDRTVCGHCDNCVRNAMAAGSTIGGSSSEDKSKQIDRDEGDEQAETSAVTQYASKQQVVTRDVTIEAWKVCKIIRAADALKSRITLPSACDLCRGLAKASFPTSEKNVKASLSLDKVCDGKITTLNKDDMEILMLELLMLGYVKEEFVGTSYTINSYIASGPQNIRLTRLMSEEQVRNSGIKIELSTLVTPKASKGKKKKDMEEEEDDDDTGAFATGAKAKPNTKRQSNQNEDIGSSAEAPNDRAKGKGSKAPGRDHSNPRKPASKPKKRATDTTKDTEKSIPAKKKRRKDSYDFDKDDDIVDLGLDVPSTKSARRQHLQDPAISENENDDVDFDSDMVKDIPAPLAAVSEDTDEEDDGSYPFMRDRFNKKADRSEAAPSISSARRQAALAALSRDGGAASVINGAKPIVTDNVIDLDSD